jgi:hypothetical protein
VKVVLKSSGYAVRLDVKYSGSRGRIGGASETRDISSKNLQLKIVLQV